MRNLLGWAFALLFTLAVDGQAAVKLKTIGGRPVVDGVFLNGHGPYRFLLDTGAETNHVEKALARRLGLRPTFQVEMVTVAGVTLAPGSRIEHVTLGTAEAANQEFIFTDLQGIHELSPDIRGVLGQEFLSYFDYTLDFRNHQVAFEPAPEAGTRVPFKLLHGRMAVATSLGDLVLDSGSDSLVLYRSSPGIQARLTAFSGLASSVTVGRAPELIIGGRRYHPGNAAFRPLESGDGKGLLPASLFHSIFVSNSGGFLMFDAPRPR